MPTTPTHQGPSHPKLVGSPTYPSEEYFHDQSSMSRILRRVLFFMHAPLELMVRSAAQMNPRTASVALASLLVASLVGVEVSIRLNPLTSLSAAELSNLGVGTVLLFFSLLLFFSALLFFSSWHLLWMALATVSTWRQMPNWGKNKLDAVISNWGSTAAKRMVRAGGMGAAATASFALAVPTAFAEEAEDNYLLWPDEEAHVAAAPFDEVDARLPSSAPAEAATEDVEPFEFEEMNPVSVAEEPLVDAANENSLQESSQVSSSATNATAVPIESSTGLDFGSWPTERSASDGPARDVIAFADSISKTAVGGATAASTAPAFSIGEPPVSTASKMEFPESYVVEAGDSLWSIAETLLTGVADNVDDAAVEQLWQQIYRTNAASIGQNPDIILPGTELVTGLGAEPNFAADAGFDAGLDSELKADLNILQG